MSHSMSCWVCVAALGLAMQQTPRLAEAASSNIAEPRIAYTLAFELGDGTALPITQQPVWRLSVSGTGFDPQAGAICLVFNSWGDWMEIDSLYIDMVHAQPAIDAELFPGNAVVLQQPPTWTGDFEAEFVLRPTRAGSRANQRFGMLPRWSPSYSFGQTRNVFPAVYQDAGKVDADESVQLLAPQGIAISSGWAGLSEQAQQLKLDPADGSNGFLAFGTPLDHVQRELPSGRLEVIQYGKARKIATPVADLVEKLAFSMSAALGPPSDPVIVYISDVGGGGMGTDFGLVLGYEASAPEWLIESPYYQHFIAHEFFHHWLGSKLSGSESMTWFHEGFTEYFGLWHLASTQTISRGWFRERLLELGQEAIDKSSWGSVAFADDEVQWRDGDGPNEIMAYKGGAMLAFMMDVQLRELGQPGAQQMLRDFLEAGKRELSLSDLEEWCREHELDDFWDEYVAGTTVPDLEEWADRAEALSGYFTPM